MQLRPCSGPCPPGSWPPAAPRNVGRPSAHTGTGPPAAGKPDQKGAWNEPGDGSTVCVRSAGPRRPAVWSNTGSCSEGVLSISWTLTISGLSVKGLPSIMLISLTELIEGLKSQINNSPPQKKQKQKQKTLRFPGKERILPQACIGTLQESLACWSTGCRLAIPTTGANSCNIHTFLSANCVLDTIISRLYNPPSPSLYNNFKLRKRRLGGVR